MTTLAWCTDVHLNFVHSKGLQDFYQKVRDTRANSLLLTGDISEGDRVIRHLRDLQAAVDMPVYFVLGNHDFYRSSVTDVRNRAKEACLKNPKLHWLRSGVVELTPEWGLVGVDGWADAKLGQPSKGLVELADWQFIQDYKDVQARFDMFERLRLAEQYADMEATALRFALDEAVKTYSNVLVATHIPPFKEATWHQGKHSDDNWLPWFSCKATGDVLAKYAAKHPSVKFLVLCGHTHSSGIYEHSQNLTVRTGSARYSYPEIHDVLAF